MEYMKNIAVLVQNLVQFYSIKNGIDALIKAGYPLDIFVPLSEDVQGFGSLFDDTYKALCDMGYSPQRDPKCAGHYKVLMEPYPMGPCSGISHDYKLKYKYALLSAKPEPSFHPEHNLCYDAELLFSPYEASFLKAFTNVELIGNLKYVSIERAERPKTDKKVLLYLPTYGDVSSIDSITEALSELKKDYYVITKLHHGTSFLVAEADRMGKLIDVSDEHYDHHTELAKLLSAADVVLSDNSGAIFEAFYAGVPIAVFSDDLNHRRIGSFDTTQYRLAEEGYLPHTSDAAEISRVLEEALRDDVVEKQREVRKKLFYFPEDPVSEFVSVIEKYLNDEVDRNLKAIRDVIVRNYEHYVSENERLGTDLRQRELELTACTSERDVLRNDLSECLHENEGLKQGIAERERKIAEITARTECEIEELNVKVEQKDRAIGYYESGKLYRIARKLYGLYFKIKPGGGE